VIALRWRLGKEDKSRLTVNMKNNLSSDTLSKHLHDHGQRFMSPHFIWASFLLLKILIDKALSDPTENKWDY